MGSLVGRAGAALFAAVKVLKLGTRLTRYTFDIRTEDRRTILEASGEDMLWIYAEVVCEKAKVRTDLITEAIEFVVEGTHADWVTLGRPQEKGTMKAVRMKAEPPSETADLTDDEITVRVSASIDGETYVGRIGLILEEEAQMKITILE